MKLSELRKMYDAEPVEVLGEKAKAMNTDVISRERDLYGLLFYLEKTNRFREEQSYSNSTYSDWLRDKLGMTYPQYHSRRMAYDLFDEPAINTLGIGTVSRAIRVCGAKKARAIVRQAETPIQANELIKENRKRPPIRPATKPLIERNVTATDFRALEKENAKLKATNKAQEEYIQQLEAQVEKLKATVKRYRDKEDSFIFTPEALESVGMVGDAAVA